MGFFHFQEGDCPVCLEKGGETLLFCKAEIHDICLKDWVWCGSLEHCPYCAQQLPFALTLEQ